MAQIRRNLPRSSRPSLRGYTRELATLMDVIDVLIGSNAAPSANFTGIPRPLTGIDHLQRSEVNARMARITAKANPREEV